jgi:hypothetical protein
MKDISRQPHKIFDEKFITEKNITITNFKEKLLTYKVYTCMLKNHWREFYIYHL